jgi:hypothetical protein
MRNRAKCKLCEEELESIHRHDWVQCKCGEIYIDGGLDYLRCGAKDWANFLRIEDDGTLTEVTYIAPEEPKEEVSSKPDDEPLPPTISKKEVFELLKARLEATEKIPPGAPITHYDYQDLLALMIAVLRSTESP